MKQIYINTRFGTTRINYNENADGDIIIVASPGTNIEAVIQEPIECSGINPESIVTFKNTEDVVFEPVWQEEKRRALYSDEGPNEKYLRDLMGDDAYEVYEAQW
jgi:hypothetical protein